MEEYAVAVHGVRTLGHTLKDFHEQFPPPQQAMLGPIIEPAQWGDDTAGY